MHDLGEIFTADNMFLSQYTLILKIKFIADDYMATAGLFHPEIDPAIHVNLITQFAFDCLQGIHELCV
jgi:hypothetical protein